ncbi:mercuric reductase [Pedobacter sp. MC2016-14]|uniref:mercuric reductase n=1 Tax=Pedobacter sp. MC2016-14 TaxID=2897327 RepID=UPI001E43696B|nr:mercuric reductase [Pedobacter sp. MC2016-14]MCD0490241.1 mercuric reductase [Pedobacter sp. MC2016-14]
MRDYDAIVIGAGQAGVPLAKKMAAAGLKTLLVEKRAVGGTCINDGCTPTKAMIASARMAYLAKRSDDLGIEIPSYKVNFEAIIQRKDKIISLFRGGSEKGIEKTENLNLLYGEAKFVDDHTVYINEHDGNFGNYTAKKIFINTGSSPVIPEIEGINDVDYLTSTSIMELTEIPEHLLIIGGGYIGLEFGQMFKRFGAQVTLLEKSPLLMPKEDDDVCVAMSEIFKEDGIEVVTAAKVKRLSKSSTGNIIADVEIENKSRQYTCSHILLASGRAPQTKKLGLENTSIECDERGYIKVNEYLETKAKNVYALGDVKGGPSFTHIAYNDYVIVTNNLLAKGEKLDTLDRMVPYCMFTDPQLGRIGITEREAKEQGIDYMVAKIPMKNVARAIETAETRGLMKAVVDRKSKQILGAAIIGEEGGEIMTVLQMAMMGKITYDQIRFAIIAHPLYAESLNNLFMSIHD